MQVWNVLQAALRKIQYAKTCQILPSVHHRTTLSGYIFATTACVDSRRKIHTAISPPHVLTIWWTFDPLVAEIGWRVCGTPANFNGFRVLASLLHQPWLMEVNEMLHDVPHSLGLVQYINIYIRFRGLLSARYFARRKITFSPLLAERYRLTAYKCHSNVRLVHEGCFGADTVRFPRSSIQGVPLRTIP